MDEAHAWKSRDSLQVTVAKGNIFSLLLKVHAVMFRLLVMSSEEYRISSNTSQALNTNRGSDIIVLIETGP